MSQKPSASVTTPPSADPWSLRGAVRMAQRSLWVWHRGNEVRRLLTHPSEKTFVKTWSFVKIQQWRKAKCSLSQMWQWWNAIQASDVTLTCVSLKAFDPLFMSDRTKIMTSLLKTTFFFLDSLEKNVPHPVELLKNTTTLKGLLAGKQRYLFHLWIPTAHNQTIWNSIWSCVQESIEYASAYLTRHGLHTFQKILCRILNYCFMSKVFLFFSEEKCSRSCIAGSNLRFSGGFTIRPTNLFQRHKGQNLLSVEKQKNS